MKLAAIKKAADKISKKYGMPMPIVERVRGASGDNQIEIRSELTLEEGGSELSALVSKIDPAYICEAWGGCVYHVYRCN